MKQYGKHHFLEDDEGYVHVYTDGSCENNGRANAVAGFGVYFGEGHSLYVLHKINAFEFPNKLKINSFDFDKKMQEYSGTRRRASNE